MESNNQVQTIMMLTQGENPGYTVTEYLENQINSNNGKFTMSFCNLPSDLKPTKLEFRFINGIPKDNIIMNFSQGCPNPDWIVTEYITNQINANNGDFVMTFSLNAPADIQLNSLDFQFENNQSTANDSVFQLSALSQNDPGVADGNKLFCNVTSITGGTLRSGSFPINRAVALPIPPGQNGSGPTPTWFIVPDNTIQETAFNIEVSCPTDSNYPATKITVKASDVQKWAAIPYNERDNQIYQEGEYGIFGFAQEGPNGLIYTVTAGVLNPQLQG
jgi:hypothetical protein